MHLQQNYNTATFITKIILIASFVPLWFPFSYFSVLSSCHLLGDDDFDRFNDSGSKPKKSLRFEFVDSVWWGESYQASLCHLESNGTDDERSVLCKTE